MSKETFYMEDLDEYTRIAPDAFDSEIGKEVPLKDKPGGTVIGTATLLGKNDDDTLSFQVRVNE